MICRAIGSLIDYALKKDLIVECDVYVVRNALMDLLCVEDWAEFEEEYEEKSIDEILDTLVDYAIDNKLINDTANSRDLFDTKIMGILTPMPREVMEMFYGYHYLDPKQATDFYYEQSKDLNYVRAGRMAKDAKWKYNCEYGELDITINLSKPEKDPRDIAMLANKKSSSYPKCQLCPENAGYAGRADHPARQNLRPISFEIDKENWFFQYSPYGYYNEHCIFFNEKHIPMKIDRAVFYKLCDILDFLPHYFVGSNADLPIVGGSILTHEHFQGGRYTFAMETAAVEREIIINEFPDVSAGIVKWPMSVIRLSSENKEEICECANLILTKWREYSDESVGIYAFTNDIPHNTVTPIMRKKGSAYECDLVLRNNITTEKRPLGVFHPNPTLHNIKKENIGLIEVMGLAVLPGRLCKEIAMLEMAMLQGEDIHLIPALEHHAVWADDIRRNHPEFNAENAGKIIEEEIGKVYLEVLLDSGVYKRNEEGQKAFLRFVEYINN